MVKMAQAEGAPSYCLRERRVHVRFLQEGTRCGNLQISQVDAFCLRTTDHARRISRPDSLLIYGHWFLLSGRSLESRRKFHATQESTQAAAFD
jgi:hypothetical protein